MENKFDIINRQDLYIYLHQFSLSNIELLNSSKLCGCFYCKRIFDKELIKDWIPDKGGKTALCPFCAVDSILPDSVTELSKKLLDEMHEYWF